MIIDSIPNSTYRPTWESINLDLPHHPLHLLFRQKELNNCKVETYVQCRKYLILAGMLIIALSLFALSVAYCTHCMEEKNDHTYKNKCDSCGIVSTLGDNIKLVQHKHPLKLFPSSFQQGHGCTEQELYQTLHKHL